jgi:pyruvate,water dikinase
VDTAQESTVVPFSSERGTESGRAPGPWVRWFSEIGIADVAEVGGKNASLGEMLRELSGLGIPVPDGFAITATAFRAFLRHNNLEELVRAELAAARGGQAAAVEKGTARLRDAVLGGSFPAEVEQAIRLAYRELGRRVGIEQPEVAVRSSGTAEDLPRASFAGAHQSFLNVRGEQELLSAVRRCYASLYSARAIAYREHMGFDQVSVALSVGVQQMLASDASVSGVVFTLDTETGFRDVVLVTAAYGLGENIVQGRVVPDEYYVHKPMLRAGKEPLLWRKLGGKEYRLVFDREKGAHDNRPVPLEERERFALSDAEVLQLARWALAIEDHYSRRLGRPTPMDIEFAKDGPNGPLCIVQARPETVHASKARPTLTVYELEGKGQVVVQGLAVGNQIATGQVRLLRDIAARHTFREGEILVTEMTDPDWEPVMKRSAAIVTERGGRTSHAAIVARELGIPAVVGAAGALEKLQTGQTVTVSCAEGEAGKVYAGALQFRVTEVDPATLPATRTKIMLNVGDPEQAFRLGQLPSDGVGLARMEFIFASWVRIHPLAVTRFDTLPRALREEITALTHGYGDRTEYFIDRLAQGIAVLAAAFWPRPVILRFSDFKSNEYAALVGGAHFEPAEANPMLGWRGASRYYHPDYREGFLLEVAAVRRVRERMGLTNLKVMIPFCRTPEEGARVLEVLRQAGMERGKEGLEVYVMAEIPSNVLLADRFAELFDGFSIGSNDLTQLVLGVDRDSNRIASLFDENNEAVRRACAALIESAHKSGRTVGICGQAPSDYPDFAAFLVERGIDSMSLNPDALLRTRLRVAEVESTGSAKS